MRTPNDIGVYNKNSSMNVQWTATPIGNNKFTQRTVFLDHFKRENEEASDRSGISIEKLFKSADIHCLQQQEHQGQQQILPPMINHQSKPEFILFDKNCTESGTNRNHNHSSLASVYTNKKTSNFQTENINLASMYDGGLP